MLCALIRQLSFKENDDRSLYKSCKGTIIQEWMAI